ncbi:hypothetical protein AB1Y20_001885 [Prymnesium parvum]|uniref:Histone H2A n=1 Tax=Prymnesium parvum TaxID=97485 RepID=A0AB34J9K2_PRYPA
MGKERRGRTSRFIRRHGDGRPLADDCVPALVAVTAAYARAVAEVAAKLLAERVSHCSKRTLVEPSDVLAAISMIQNESSSATPKRMRTLDGGSDEMRCTV